MQCLLLTVSLLFLPVSAFAHQYWIEPNEFIFFAKTKEMDKKVSENLTFEFSGGDTYFNADVNRTHGDESNYTQTFLNPDGSPIEHTAEIDGITRHAYEAKAKQTGTYTLAVSRTGEPMYYTKLMDDSWVGKSKDQLSEQEKAGAKAIGGYFQHTKSYVTLHEPNNSWKKPLGHELEIIPQSHPNTLFTGDSLKIQVLYKGELLKNAKVVGIYQGFRAKEHGKTPISVQTDENGYAKLTFARASRWLVAVKHAEPLENSEKADFHEHKASLMLEVNEPWVKDWLD